MSLVFLFKYPSSLLAREDCSFTCLGSLHWGPPKISELFIRSNKIHSHYTRIFAEGNFHVQRPRLDQLLLSFSRRGVRIWNKIPLKLHDSALRPFQAKLHKLLAKVLETEEVYVEMSAINSSYPNSLFS